MSLYETEPLQPQSLSTPYVTTSELRVEWTLGNSDFTTFQVNHSFSLFTNDFLFFFFFSFRFFSLFFLVFSLYSFFFFFPFFLLVFYTYHLHSICFISFWNRLKILYTLFRFALILGVIQQGFSNHLDHRYERAVTSVDQFDRCYSV